MPKTYDQQLHDIAWECVNRQYAKGGTLSALPYLLNTYNFVLTWFSAIKDKE